MYQFSFTKSEFEIFPQLKLPPGPGIPSTTPHRSVRRMYTAIERSTGAQKH